MHFYKKQYFVTLNVTLSSLTTCKLSTKLHGFFKSLINYQKNCNEKDKIKCHMHFGNTFTAIINYNYLTLKQTKGKVLKWYKTFKNSKMKRRL